MSRHMIDFQSIEARLKGHNVILQASGPEDNEATVTIEGVDIRQQYGCNPAAFVERYENDPATLFDLFYSVYYLSVAD